MSNHDRVLLYGKKQSLAASVLPLLEEQLVIEQASGMEELWKTKMDAGGILLIWDELLSLWQWSIWHEEKEETSLEEQMGMCELEKNPQAFWQWFGQLCQMQEVPIIVYLSGRDDFLEYECLRHGAAECVCRRQRPQLQVYRIVRQMLNYVEQKPELFHSGRVIIDKDRHIFETDGVTYHLSPREFVAFEMLWDRKNNLVGREELSTYIWGIRGEDRQRALDMIIRSLRKKLSSTCFEIVTVYGKGYYLKENTRKD